MTQKIRYSVITALAIAAVMFFAPSFISAPPVAQAQATNPCTGGTGGTVGVDCPEIGLRDIKGAFPSGATRTLDVPSTVRLVINWALYLAAIIAVIFVIIGGFLYITSAGNEGQAGKGRTTMINALIGLVIIVLSYLIVSIVYNFITN